MKELPKRTLVLTAKIEDVIGTEECPNIKEYCNKKYIVKDTEVGDGKLLYVLEDFSGNELRYGWYLLELTPLSLDKYGSPEPIDNDYRHSCYWCFRPTNTIRATTRVIQYCPKCGK